MTTTRLAHAACAESCRRKRSASVAAKLPAVRLRFITCVTDSTSCILSTRSGNVLLPEGRDDGLRVAGRDAPLFAQGAAQVFGRGLSERLVYVGRAGEGEQGALRGLVVYSVEALDAEASS